LFGLKCGVTDEAVLDRGEVLREEVINDDALCRWPGVAIEVDARKQTVDVGEHLGCVVPAELPARVAQAIGVSVVWQLLLPVARPSLHGCSSRIWRASSFAWVVGRRNTPVCAGSR
jgi:hypothetical protein